MIKNIIRQCFSAVGLEIRRKDLTNHLKELPDFHGYDYGQEGREAIKNCTR
ncbi:MAG: hypothetical protein IPO98_18025 [Saprospiraceae bacterium]|nr:hypothetical protein [Saprospiraceae bacterium]